MKLVKIIGLDTLGDVNTSEDNGRFIQAVKVALIHEYPDADITVELGEFSSIYVDNDGEDPGGIEENVNDITNTVWGRADY